MASKIRIIAVGKVKEQYIKEGIAEFTKRLGPFCKLEVIELPDEGIAKEEMRQRKYLEQADANSCFVLDEQGKEHTSEEFAQLIKKSETTLTFIIGGHDGISEHIKKQAKLVSLSKMTFTHEMARLFLIEQIYRGFMIANNRKYHR